jgi:hypothetical protein
VWHTRFGALPLLAGDGWGIVALTKSIVAVTTVMFEPFEEHNEPALNARLLLPLLNWREMSKVTSTSGLQLNVILLFLELKHQGFLLLFKDKEGTVRSLAPPEPGPLPLRKVRQANAFPNFLKVPVFLRSRHIHLRTRDRGRMSFPLVPLTS